MMDEIEREDVRRRLEPYNPRPPKTATWPKDIGRALMWATLGAGLAVVAGSGGEPWATIAQAIIVVVGAVATLGVVLMAGFFGVIVVGLLTAAGAFAVAAMIAWAIERWAVRFRRPQRRSTPRPPKTPEIT